MNRSRSEDAVAIVGYSHRLPGPLRSDADFWHLLSTRDVVRSPVAGRFGKGVRPVGSGANFGRFASPYEGLIDDDVRFALDAGFFGLSRTEMEQASPMARMLMSCSWEAIEHSGCCGASTRSATAPPACLSEPRLRPKPITVPLMATTCSA